MLEAAAHFEPTEMSDARPPRQDQTRFRQRRAEGQTDVVLRQDIEEIQSTGVSLMPEGLEKNIGINEMADLLAFLKNWRYLDGKIPVGN